MILFTRLAMMAAISSASMATKRDVLMIAVDDMRPEMGCYGCDYMKTPVLDELASESMVFDHMYTGVAVCSPSRTLFLTTRRADTSRVWIISPKEYWRLSGGNFTSLPQHFLDNGYLTLGTGKIFHPGLESNNSDSEYSWSPECLPYQNTFPEPNGESIYSSPAVHPYNISNDDEMGEGKLALHMVKLLELIANKRKAGDSRPFFMAAGFHRPHIPYHAPTRYYDMYDLDMPVAPNQHPPAKSPTLALNSCWIGKNFSYDVDGNLTYPGQGYYTGNFKDLAKVPISSRMPEDGTTVPIEEQQRMRQAYRASLSFTDRNIGVVIAAAKRLGLYDNAIVALWGDHGIQLGDQGEWDKHTVFEHATRIPFMVRLPKAFFPNFQPGRTAAFVENVDLYPTLAELAMSLPMERCPADANASRSVETCTEGLSFAPVLMSSNLPWKNASFSQYSRIEESIMGYSIRTTGWRYSRWVKFDKSKAGYPGGAQWNQTVGEELYVHSLNTLPCDWSYEAVNVVDDPQYASIREELSTKLIDGWRGALPPDSQ